MALWRHGQKLHQHCGGRLTARENLHLTLVFIGNVAVGKLSGLEGVAGAISATAFEFVVDQTDYWKHNGIVWAAPRIVPQPLRQLVAALESALLNAGYKFDVRSYVPHMTLIRNARAPSALPAIELPWRVSEFSLVESVRDAHAARYRVVARWPLASGGR